MVDTMVNEVDSLARLKKEREYEDDLVYDLINVFLLSLKEISDLKHEEETIVRDRLTKIASDSKRHSHLFETLIEMVIKNGDNNY
ncbi:MAG: hypothetical protein WAU65_01765 [Candidatus Nanoarchaeia archaeon]